MKIHVNESPNFASRKGYGVVGTVVHVTGDGLGWNPVKWMTMKESGVSCHFHIDRDGKATRLVKLTDCAWHAEPAEWDYHGETDSDVNEYSIGVELSNALLLRKKAGEFYWEQGRRLLPYRGPTPVEASLVYENGNTIEGYWEPYAEAQIQALHELIEKLKSIGYESAAGNLVGHEEIAVPMGRKIDPGPLFPWAEFGRTERRTLAAMESS